MNVLITGANGFIGSNLCSLLPKEKFNIIKGTRDSVDLYSLPSVRKFIKSNNIDAIVHCAIEGGRRNTKDIPDIVYRNISMFENLVHSLPPTAMFINIGSGAEYDRSRSIDRFEEFYIHDSVPTDYYGFSKSIITKRLLKMENSTTLTLFGCFYYNEATDRFIRSNIERYIRGEPIIIHQDRYMDFFYMEDLSIMVEHLLGKGKKHRLEWWEPHINMTYNNPKKLSEIANIINNLTDKNVDIIIQDKTMGNSYTGQSYGMKIEASVNQLKGLECGIKECYARIKENYILH